MRDPLPIPTGRRAAGRVRPPGSKSVSHRYLTLSLLQRRPRRIENLLQAEDLDLYLAALEGLGWRVERSPADAGFGDSAAGASASPSWVEVVPGAADAPDEDRPRRIDCGNAGTMYRFLTAALTVVPGRFLLDGTPRLRERPIAPLVDALRQLGAEIRYAEREGCAPLRIRGESLRGGRCSLDAGVSSQFLSALLMAGPFADEPIEIEVQKLTSRPYVAVTERALVEFGVPPGRALEGRHRIEPLSSAGQAARDTGAAPRAARTVVVESDYSAAPYPAAAALLTGGEVRLAGLAPDSAQGDRRFFEVLERLGGTVRWEGDELVVGGSVARPVDEDLGSMPDQVPTLAALSIFAPGRSRIRNVAHLRAKESDRLAAMTTELNRLGARVRETDDGLVIDPVPLPSDGPTVDVATYDDHRIAMSLGLVGLRRPLRVSDPATVGKSYRAFWRDLFALVGERLPDEPG